MGVLEDLFLRDFDAILGTEELNGEPINMFQFCGEEAQPCLETPEFIGYVDSAIYHVSKEFTPIFILASNQNQVPEAFEYLQASQISSRISEYFSEELAIDSMDHLERYSTDLMERTKKFEEKASSLLQNLLKKYSVREIEMDLTFDESENYNLKEDNPIIDAIHFASDYQTGWNAFEKGYDKLFLLDHEGFAEEVVRSYFSEPERALPFVFSDLASAVEEPRR